MKKIILVSIIAILLFSCNSRKISFSKNELQLLRPFQSVDTVIYQSKNSLRDTIIFYNQENSKSSVNNFEQGFYTTYSINVRYKLTKGSYHKFVQSNAEDESSYLISLSKNTNAVNADIEVYFLGLLFNNAYLNGLKNDGMKTITFDESTAEYKNLNIIEGIKSFDFNFQIGIVSFIDNNNLRWVRKNQ
jgi:hypothetical protein